MERNPTSFRAGKKLALCNALDVAFAAIYITKFLMAVEHQDGIWRANLVPKDFISTTFPFEWKGNWKMF